MIGAAARRASIAAIACFSFASSLASSLVACAPAATPLERRAIDPPLMLDPLTDLAPAAGLTWLVDAKPRAFLANADAAGAVRTALPTAPLDALARADSGVDWREATELVIAGFGDATLWLLRVPVDSGRVERAFTRNALAVEGRAEEHGVTRFWGTAGGVHTQVAIFGHGCMAVEEGRFGPLRVAAYFAEGRLRRSPRALRAPPLAEMVERLGDPDAPLRVFAPGPFEGGAAGGVGGLLRAATAFGGRFAPSALPGAVDARVVLTGGWGAEWRAAAERLDAFFRVLAEDPLGHLLGVDQPASPSAVRGDGAGVELDVALDVRAIARGIRAATSASLAEILGKPDESTVAH